MLNLRTNDAILLLVVSCRRRRVLDEVGAMLLLIVWKEEVIVADRCRVFLAVADAISYTKNPQPIQNIILFQTDKQTDRQTTVYIENPRMRIDRPSTKTININPEYL